MDPHPVPRRTARSSTSASSPAPRRSSTAPDTRAGTTTTRSTSAPRASRPTTCTAAAPTIAERFATYFEGDGVGQLEHYDGNDDNAHRLRHQLHAGQRLRRHHLRLPEARTRRHRVRARSSAPSPRTCGARSTPPRQLYEIAGADSGQGRRDGRDAPTTIRDAILGRLWSDRDADVPRRHLARRRVGSVVERQGQPAARRGGARPDPGEGVEPLRRLRREPDPDRGRRHVRRRLPLPALRRQLPDLPVLHGQPVRPGEAYGIGGSNNFSNINFTVQYRGVRAALRHYDPDAEVRHAGVRGTPARLDGVEHLPGRRHAGGEPGRVLLELERDDEDVQPQQPEPRDARQHELHLRRGHGRHPAAVRRQGRALADRPRVRPLHGQQPALPRHGRHDRLGRGRQRTTTSARATACSSTASARPPPTRSGRFVYDPAANEVVEIRRGSDRRRSSPRGRRPARRPWTPPIEDERVVSYLKTAGIDLTEDAAEPRRRRATLSSSFTQEGARPTPWRNFHTPGYSTASMNYTPGAIIETERPVSLDAVNGRR